ncbi:hypothetical protein Pla108_40690 [Botrimarina colliarenosi]|uniref:Translocation protein TolB n=1 Tax=Botrimarina colliarenosi TaxID=2528001 RepID=A0A5C6A036_9BACT|nr:PD40 domain-containing protein [Botrimarina colliarenosi]TWT92929.1 hypothetical protein Pla108_40690 [Botrimarina colliarenosi]
MRGDLWLAATLATTCVAVASPALAVRISTSPATTTELEFSNIAITPDGATIIANGVFSSALAANGRDRLYRLTVPTDLVTGTANVTQITTTNAGIVYDTDFTPVLTPGGSVLATHDALGQTNRLYTVPLAGEGGGAPNGFFNPNPNLVSPGNGNFAPKFSPDGSTLYFLNSNAGFDGSVPAFPGSPVPFIPRPDWDVLYRIPAGGGAATAVTSSVDGDLDLGFFDLTPNGATVIYAPDNPVVNASSRDNIRPKLFTVPAAGGVSVEVPITAPGHDFTITNHLAAGPDGQSVLFIADYLEVGKQELFSLPLTGGVPVRLNDPLPFAGDVTSFAVSPDGLSVAYAAGQNTSATTELFYKPIAGGPSVRISEPPPSNSGQFDVNTSLGEGDQSVYEGGQIVFDPDGSRVFYLGAMTTPGVVDLFAVDTTEKAGLVPSVYTYTGPAAGDFFDESNWTDADGAPAPSDTINAGSAIYHSLLIDGASVTTSGGEIDFGFGGSLELTPGSLLTLPDFGGQLDFNPGSGLKLTDASIIANADVILEGTTVLNGGLLESQGDDIEFQDRAEVSIVGTTLRAFDILVVENSVTSVQGATFESGDRLSMRYEVDYAVTDTAIVLESGRADIEDGFAGNRGEGSRLILKGTSTLLADTIEDGVDLILEDSASASLIDSGPTGGSSQMIDPANGESLIIFNSYSAELVVRNDSEFDPRQYIINGFTGLSYLDDPNVWNEAGWDGLSPLASLRLALAVALPGDYNDDGRVDAADYTVWRDALDTSITLPNDLTPGSVSPSDYDVWVNNYGTVGSVAIPEPTTLTCALAAAMAALRPRREPRGGARPSNAVRELI